MEKYLYDCKKCLQAFLKEACGDENNIDFLKTFNFSYLLTKEGMKKYGCVELNDEYINFCETFNGDEDGTFLARLIYVLLWYDELPKLTHAHTSFNTGSEKYGGDTLNPIKDSIYYLTIGNFMILPKGKAKNEITTLNQYKMSVFNDDFYLFVNKIKEMYEGKEIKNNNIWRQLFIESNDFYFNKIKDFSEFVKINMLEGWKKLEDFDREKVENFVKNRNDRICEKLEAVFKRLDKD